LARHGSITAIGIALALFIASAPNRPRAQDASPIGLTAESVTYDREAGLLTAEGDVEVLHQGRVLRAPRLVYDENAETVTATGPIVLVDPQDGVLLADAAALTSDLAEGLIEGARVLINGQFQLSAVEARRRGGRFVTLDRVVASGCTICEGDPTPTWSIRAARVTQDPAARRIYFENAWIEVLGVPIGFVPRLSIPEPGVERASGFLAPIFLSSQIYGFGAKTPYYRVLGPSADMTITPFATSQGGALVEGEYRRRFARGGFDLGGVFALEDGLDDDLGGAETRWFLTALGDYRLGRGFIADFDLSVVSDDVFLKQFDYSDADILTSTAQIRRTRANDTLRLELIAFQNLLPDTGTESVPAVLPNFVYRRELDDPVVGGRAALDLQVLSLMRDSGQSMLRGTGGLDWRREWTLPRGIRAAARAGGALDSYQVWNDAENGEEFLNRVAPTASVELRWPFVRRDERVDQVLEPIVQVIFSDLYGDTDTPNEDSELPEFSTTNLFSLNRFPGRDRLETGARANMGLQYTRHDPDGWDLGLTFGRVLRATDLDQFPTGTGLDGRWSDYVGAMTLDFDWGLNLSNRLLMAGDFEFTRNEFALAYESDRTTLGASYVYLAEDASNEFLGTQNETSELALAARYRILPNWDVRANWRFDAARGSSLRAGGGVTYGNECAEIDLSVSRRYTSSDNLPKSTTIGFGLRLAGLGASQTRNWPPRACAVAG
jgi:LPS-assembly protein